MTEKEYLIFDGHLDLAMNAIDWNRDLRWSIEETRAFENNMDDKPDRGNNMVSFEALKHAGIGLCMATQIARYVKKDSELPGWNSPEQAWAHTQAQLSWYRCMEEAGFMKQITGIKDLETHLKEWNNMGKNSPLGYILSLEGADSIVNIDYLEKAWEYGLRAIGPAHYGPGRYAQGTNATGGIGNKGKELLKEMERLGIILDATHLCDDSFWEAMDNFNGAVWASHNNCRSMVPHNRQFSDEQIVELLGRGAVIGGVFDAWMLVPGWVKGKSTPESDDVSLHNVVDHIDRVCQLAGNSLHSAVGTDLDGGFGKEQSPKDMESIADLPRIIGILKDRGYEEQDIRNILSENWIRFLRKHWE